MYRWVGAWDGMETNINSRLTDDEFGGGEGFRPTLNSYLWADLSALARTATLFGDYERAVAYARRAAAAQGPHPGRTLGPEACILFPPVRLRRKGRHPGRHAHVRVGALTQGTPTAGTHRVRTLAIRTPRSRVRERPWASLLDSASFAAPFGPTTVEKGDPQFLVSPRCCVWSGNAWPYATSQTLTAMARLVQDYDQDVVTRTDYAAALSTFARTQQKDGRPYIAEASDPFTGSWPATARSTTANTTSIPASWIWSFRGWSAFGPRPTSPWR